MEATMPKLGEDLIQWQWKTG